MIVYTSLPFFIPAWPVPKKVKAYSTLRYPGFSHEIYSGFNLAYHTGDDVNSVSKNRLELMNYLDLPSQPKWLNQVHSAEVLLAEHISEQNSPFADASYTKKTGLVCVVMTADCLPILITNKQGTEVGAIHAGWQGLSKGIVENMFDQFNIKAEEALIWMGPCIGSDCYEVGEEVYLAFSNYHSLSEMKMAFRLKADKKYLANVPLLASQRLIRLGVSRENIYLSQECTYSCPEKYFSYRRDGLTGRMASLIYLD